MIRSPRHSSSWFGQFNKRCAWRAEWETIERARHEIGAYIEHYHLRSHSGLAYRTPLEVATTWRGHLNPEKLQTLST